MCKTDVKPQKKNKKTKKKTKNCGLNWGRSDLSILMLPSVNSNLLVFNLIISFVNLVNIGKSNTLITLKKSFFLTNQ